MPGSHTFKVLGIDPGSRVTGYGLVEKARCGLVWVTHGEIRPGRGTILLSQCLETIYDRLHGLIEETGPDAMSIEDIFYGKNVKSLIRQGHVRGAAILAAKHLNIPVFEYNPLEIKKAVVGYGRAEKVQVQMMIKAMLKLAEVPLPDAADALAAAVCHIHFQKTEPV